MKKVAVVFKSTYGHTKKYAEWISEELNADLLNGLKVKPQTLDKYDIVIYGGGLYATGINGASLLSDNFEKLKKKKLVIFAVGIEENLSEAEYTKVLTHNFSIIMQRDLKVFYLRGGINYKKLSVMHKIIMSNQKKLIEQKQEKTKQDELYLKTYGVNIDFTDKKNIQPVVDYVKSLQLQEEEIKA